VTRPAKTARLSQRIDPGLKRKIADEAERRHLDETAIVTIALNEYFARQAITPDAPIPDKLT
jgi:predicted transcriptional regulator